MSKNVRIVLLVFAGLFCLVFVGVCMFRRTPLGHELWPPRYPATASDVPVFTTPPAYNNRMLRLELRARTVSVEEEGVILITRGEAEAVLPEVPNQWPVYKYDHTSAKLTVVQATEWKNAGGAIAEQGGGRAGYGFFRREVDGVLKYGFIGSGSIRDFDTRGKYAVDVTASPDGQVIGVLTADGPKRPSSGPGMVFGSWGGGFYGQHYIEFFHLPDMKPIGKPVRIPFTTVNGIDTPCWLPDGRFVIYANRAGRAVEDGTQMCVIHVGEERQDP